MEKITPTPGEAIIRKDENTDGLDTEISMVVINAYSFSQIFGKTKFEVQSNATLYCDAHNTFNKCGLLPSELLERVEELENCFRSINGIQPWIGDSEVKALFQKTISKALHPTKK